MQVRQGLRKAGINKDFAVLEFQIVGIPEPNPKSQLRSTTYCRLFAEAATPQPLTGLLNTLKDIALQHFSGFHSALDFRTAIPKPFLAYHPSLYPQYSLEEPVIILATSGTSPTTIPADHPPAYESFERRESYDSPNPTSLSTFGPTQPLPLGGIALARSGDKGSNLNCGLFVRNAAHWSWFRTVLSRAKFIELMGEDWREEFFMERVELEGILAVHFVVYGILGKRVSGSTRLDCLGEGFADYIRDKVVDVPVALLGHAEECAAAAVKL